MSEHQYVGFRAIDKPVSDDDLEYMARQSSRADITPWSFDNEYHFGDFRGNALEMLRRGYDIHLHYANFGIRKLLIRFPQGLPDERMTDFFGQESLQFIKDKKRSGGTLCIEPSHEPGALKDIYDFDDMLDRLAPLRDEILNGDLRPLYLGHLIMANDDCHDPEVTKEAPVPAGLGKLTDAQKALAELYGLGDALIKAAAKGSPPMAAGAQPGTDYADWLKSQPAATKDGWLEKLLSNPESSVRLDMLAAFRNSQKLPSWPTVQLDRTIAELHRAAEEVRKERTRVAAEKAARDRKKKLAALAADPDKILLQSEQIVEQRKTSAYIEASQLLADLREALAGTHHSGLAEQQALKLKKQNPSKILAAELRKAGFTAK